MKRHTRGIGARTIASLLLGGAVGIGLCAQAATAAEVQKGGTLNFVVAGEAPSKDGHREQTYALGSVSPGAVRQSVSVRALERRRRWVCSHGRRQAQDDAVRGQLHR